MKKTMMILALCSSLLLLNACGKAKPADTAVETTAPETAAVDAETTETASSDETTEAASDAETTETATDTETLAEDDTSGTEEETQEMNGAPDSDFVTIAGDWYIDGDTSAASLHIEPDGTFKTYYATGSLENEGTIRYEAEEIEESTHYWYNLYNKDDEFIMGFLDDGSEVKTDLYDGNGGEPHYQKLTD